MCSCVIRQRKLCAENNTVTLEQLIVRPQTLLSRSYCQFYCSIVTICAHVGAHTRWKAKAVGNGSEAAEKQLDR
jgi:hypothetical protein